MELAKLNPTAWEIESLKPAIHHWTEHNLDAVLALLPLPELPGYGFPFTLTAELSHPDPKIWFRLWLEFEFHPAMTWPELTQERRTPRPDWIRNRHGRVIALRPAPVGQDVAIPLARELIPHILAAATIPLDKPLRSQLGQSFGAIRPLIKPRRLTPLTDARLVEIQQIYEEALADPSLNKSQRLRYVARELGNSRSDTSIREAIAMLEKTGAARKPHHDIPITATRIRYWIKPETEINHICFGADPVIHIYADDEYQTTDHDTIYRIIRDPNLGIEILEHDTIRGLW